MFRFKNKKGDGGLMMQLPIIASGAGELNRCNCSSVDGLKRTEK
jgi:hypothetical protein